MKQLLKNKDYMLYWFATTFSMAASNLVQFVLSLYVLNLTGSATLFASMLAITFLPRIFLSPVSGVVGDRWPIKPTMIILGLVSGVVLLTYGFIGLGGQPLTLVSIYVLVVLLEVVETLYSGPSTRMVPTLVDKALLKEANALSTVDDGIVGVLTPVLGGLLYASLGVVGSCFVAGGFFIISVLLKLGINLEKDRLLKGEIAAKNNKTSPFKDFTDGLKALKENNVMLKFSLNAMMLNFFIAPITIVINYFLLEQIKVGEVTYGVFSSVVSAVSVGVPIVILPFIGKMNIFKTLPKGFAGIGLGVVVVLAGVLSFGYWQTSAALVIAIVTLGISTTVAFATVLNILSSAAFPYLVQEAYWARVGSITGVLCTLAIPLGQMLYGWMADSFGAASPVVLSLAGCIASVFLAKSMIKSIPKEVHEEIEKAKHNQQQKVDENAVLL